MPPAKFGCGGAALRKEDDPLLRGAHRYVAPGRCAVCGGDPQAPATLAGQVHGGTAQGIGQALRESTVYDPASRQLMRVSQVDYAWPRAIDVPLLAFETADVPCRTNPSGGKGAGEAGGRRLRPDSDERRARYPMTGIRYGGNRGAGLGRGGRSRRLHT
jgi:molybdopterin-binding aldehyde dehydrogenase-like protein